ncbi:replication protein A 70 kDa DNA-binding subunit E-like [Silene latifolia]|uniref:replication protein A 70 kDa DNA-binding subunit E-like n=1 Tax=Silene latifolia TaxID=37657 RepID=UPI003D7764BD
MLIPVPGKFRTVGLTTLRVSNYRGFSMSTSMSTIIIHSPVGAKAEALASWMTNHQMALTELQSRVFNVKMPIPAQKNVKIAALRSKKAKTTLQDGKHWLEVTIPAAELHKVNAYMGCSHCSKRSSIPPGSAYTCENCSEADCTTEPKITFNCDISDGTGTLPMTAFSSTTEKLFKMSAADIFHMKHADDDQAFSAVQEMLRLKPFKVQVGPSTSLSMSNILQWVVKQVVIDGTNDNASGSVTATQADPSQSQVVSSSKGSQVQTRNSSTPPPKSKVTDASITSAVTASLALLNQQ